MSTNFIDPATEKLIENEFQDEHNAVDIQQLLPPTYTDTLGLDCLRTIDTLIIKQEVSLLEVICGVTSNTRYDIYNKKKERILQALETSSFYERFCCPSSRRFTLHIINNINQNILVFKREFKCCGGCCAYVCSECCRQEVTIETPTGILLGTVSQKGSFYRFAYRVKDANGKTVFIIMAPTCLCDGSLTCCCKTKFRLIGIDGETEIGAIYKQYNGFFSEGFSSADTYLYKVPMDLDVKMKAVVLSAVFLIDFMLFSSIPCLA